MAMSDAFKGILTYSGILFDPFDPDPELINLTDISHALSYQNRFNGHTRRPLSVAEHSLNVYKFVVHYDAERWENKQALMHDATEAYIPDLASPIKHRMPEFQALEAKIWHAICVRFGIQEKMSELVELGDKEVFHYEFHTTMTDPDAPPKFVVPQPKAPFRTLPAAYTKSPSRWAHEFREQCHKLGIE